MALMLKLLPFGISQLLKHVLIFSFFDITMQTIMALGDLGFLIRNRTIFYMDF